MMEVIEGTPGQPGQPGQGRVADGVLAVILSQFASPPLVESKEVPAQPMGFASSGVPPLDALWDVDGATKVISQVDTLIDAALAQGSIGANSARQHILANERIIVRHLQQTRDPF